MVRCRKVHKHYPRKKAKDDVTKTNLQLEPYQVILRPIMTEKGVHCSERLNTYSFEVNQLASKATIKAAIEQLFEVRVISVNVQNRRGKTRRTRKGTGVLRSWKKALVTLHPDSRINYF
ncbi:MAG: 50S ribosomal protein L23 [Thermoguttaceae bacterium]